MTLRLRSLSALLIPFTFILHARCQSKAPIQRVNEGNGLPATGGYKPPATSLFQLMETDAAMNGALMTYVRTGDKAAYRSTVLQAADSGSLAAELLLAEQYIPEQCTFEPDQDVPNCGKDGKQPPHVVFRQNPLGVEASYEQAALWLEKASAQGSGEASEVLAQLITRMLSNGHATTYTAADSTRLHALARSQGFDVERVSVTCFKLVPGAGGLTVGRLPGLIVGNVPRDPFSEEELAALRKAGLSGSLLYGGGTGAGDSVLLMRPEGPVVNVRIILDHDPGEQILLPLPAHHDETYVQRGNDFLQFPAENKSLERFINIEPIHQPAPQVSVSVELMSGAHSGGFCTRFP